MSNILITAIGSFSADIVIKNLKKYEHRIIGTDVNQKEVIVDAYNVDKFYRSPYASNEMEYINFIVDLIKKENIQYIFPLIDYEIDVINKYRKIIEKRGCTVCISDHDVIDVCRNKMESYEFLSKKGLTDCIPTQRLSEVKDFSSIEYPLVLKPCDGRSSQGLKYVNNASELTNCIDEIDKYNYICQPKIDGIVVTVDVLRDINTGKIVSVARKELLRTSNGAGISVYVFKDSNLELIVNKIANALNIKGCVNFEFIYNEESEKYFFIECNPRFSGGVEFSCIASYDMVINHLNVYIGKKIDNINPFKNQFIARKYEEFVTRIE